MSQSSAIMNGKRGLIMGVANDRSIAWGIAAQAAAAGAELAFTYQGDALKKRVRTACCFCWQRYGHAMRCNRRSLNRQRL